MTNRDEIRKEAKQIMDNFMDALREVKIEEEFVLHREKNSRNEGLEEEVDCGEFKQRFLSNAPKVSGDCIVANKGGWTK